MMADPVGTLRQQVAELEQALADERAQSLSLRDLLAAQTGRLRYLDAAMEMVPVGVVLADADGHIFHGNTQVEQLVGHPVLHSGDYDSYGEWIAYHADGTQVQSHEYPLSRVIRDGEERAELDVHYQRGDDGRLVWMRVIGMPIYDDHRNRIGASVAMIDIDRERRLAATQTLLIAELNHRVKNAFAVVNSIVSQSLRRAGVDAQLRAEIEKRLHAYGSAHAALLSNHWDEATLQQIADEVLAKFSPGRISYGGDEVVLPARQSLAFSMAFYELATNALKHGALTVPDGRVKVDWRVDTGGDRPQIIVSWRERGGPPAVSPTRTGLGSLITTRAIAADTQGTVDQRFTPDGFEWHLTFPYPDPVRPKTA